jgi:predicted HD phosphohydrolase
MTRALPAKRRGDGQEHRNTNRSEMMFENLLSKRASCLDFKHITQEDCDIITAHLMNASKGLPDRLLAHFELLNDFHGGMQINRYDHSLQTATRAHQDGLDEETVVCGLLHDLGDALAPHDHAGFAAMVLRPFISEKNYWILKHHEIFQGYYYNHLAGFDRHERDAFRDSPYFEACAAFCEKYDQNSFDPNFENMPIEAFAPMVHRVLARPLENSKLLMSAATLG